MNNPVSGIAIIASAAEDGERWRVTGVESLAGRSGAGHDKYYDNMIFFLSSVFFAMRSHLWFVIFAEMTKCLSCTARNCVCQILIHW